MTTGNQVTGGSGATAGGSHGGIGGSGTHAGAGAVYGSVEDPEQPGAGGGAVDLNHPAGNGGGVILLDVLGVLTLEGSVLADGGNPGNFHGGGGAGGSIRLSVGTLTGSGIIRADGGPGGTGTNPSIGQGAGGGGRISVTYDQLDFSGSLLAGGAAGHGGGQPGGAGTIYLRDRGKPSGNLIVNGNGLNPAEASTPLLETLNQFGDFRIINTARVSSAGAITAEHLMVNNSELAHAGIAPLNVQTLELTGQALLTHIPTSVDAVHRLTVNIAQSAFIDATSSIDVTGRGFLGGRRSGNLATVGLTVGNSAAGGSSLTSGGSHGGRGGAGDDGNVGDPYGLAEDPREPGSGGGAVDTNHPGGNGGGVIFLEAPGLVTLDGSILANGAYPGIFHSGGGAGGSIQLNVGTLAGVGAVRADGGRAGSRESGSFAQGGGGGGRVSVQLTTHDYTGEVSAAGGIGESGGADGEDGSLFTPGNLLITAQPVPVTVTVNSSATFSVQFIGADPVMIQWLKDGEIVPAATAQNLTLSGLTLEDSGAVVTVRLSNAEGQITSRAVNITIVE